MDRQARWPRTVAAVGAGLVLGTSGMAGGALLLYVGERFLSSAGFLLALALAAVAAGLWVGAPDRSVPVHKRMSSRWIFAVAALVIASFVATLWLASPAFQTSSFGPPLAVVFLLAEPMYALGALLAGLAGRRAGGGVAVPALLGTAAGALVTAVWLIPALPPGPVLIGAALVLTVVGSIEMAIGHPKEAGMSERVVVVTGVGQPGQVGAAVARAFFERGHRLVVTGRGPEVEDRARELGPDVVAVRADLTGAEDAERVVSAARERWGRVDILVNAAGGLRATGPLAETSPEEWRGEQESNVTTAFVMTRAALPLLRESGGAVVNFASPAGSRPVAGLGAYSAAKAGVVALTRSLALEESGRGVRANVVAPGLVDTAANRAAMAGDGDGRDVVAMDEVVDVVLFLAGPGASGINGEVVHVLGRHA
jgi:3-oxoacyl-[acyl-carrier protein] reductase